ncbi:MAG: toll/interleukin-1 receptor domain-containing protein [Lachnospiraceae bacterium]|nr:toll/interleukin-1 receptor domain-containing protein [Lachnospiraceae bacterium]
MSDKTFRDNLEEALAAGESKIPKAAGVADGIGGAGGLTEGGIDVFLSYSSKNKNVADAVVAEFEQHGIRCWYAPRDIVPGQEWVSAIHDAITACSLFVLIYTDSSNESKQVANEVALAFNSGKTLIPFRLSDAEMSSELEYYLTRVHWLDAVNPPLRQSIENLREYSERILKGEVPRESKIRNANTNANAAASGREGKSRWISPALAVLALAAVVAVIVLVIKLTDKGNPSDEGGATTTPATATATVTPAVTEFTQETADSYYEKGYELQMSGAYEEAYEYYYYRAYEWQTKDEKIIDAMIELARYFYEKGNPEDTRKGIDLFQQASKCGSVTADNSLGGYYLELDREAKSEGRSRATLDYNGNRISEDVYQAFTYYEKSANKGDAIALFSIGLIYENEDDSYTITPDYEKALSYYKKAKLAGHATADWACERVRKKMQDNAE